MLRGVLGVVAGFILWSVMWVSAGTALQAAAPASYPQAGPIHSAPAAVLLVISIVCSLASGRAASIAARSGRGGAVWTLGALLLAVGIFVQSQLWDAMPMWYHLSFLALLVPATLLGARPTRPTRI
jgi:hypothetical protein